VREANLGGIQVETESGEVSAERQGVQVGVGHANNRQETSETPPRSPSLITNNRRWYRCTDRCTYTARASNFRALSVDLVAAHILPLSSFTYSLSLSLTLSRTHMQEQTEIAAAQTHSTTRHVPVHPLPCRPPVDMCVMCVWCVYMCVRRRTRTRAVSVIMLLFPSNKQTVLVEGSRVRS
jgi:hypothetical protein